MSVKLDRQVCVLARPDVLVCGIGCADVTATMAIKNHTNPCGVNVEELRCELVRRGAMLAGVES